jgi:NADPH-dependent 2,4-dienoyl-CoA reductase/sulfur reductase-like enzyme
VIQGGERLYADLIVAGVGVRPATALAERAEPHVANGIVVDTYLETAHPGAFAIGDAARSPDLRAGGLVRIEHWMLAQGQGQAVARTIVGESAGRRSRSTETSSSTMAWCALATRGGSSPWRASPATARASRPNWPWNTTRLRCDKTPGVPEGRRGNAPTHQA